MKDMIITSDDIGGKGLKGEIKRRGNRTTRVPEILEVSIKVFALEGNAGFTQRRVAAEAGIRLSTLQHYFSSRELLLQSTMEEMAERFFHRYRLLAQDPRESPEACLEAILDEAFAALTASGNFLSPFALECWSLAEHQSWVHELMEKVSGEFQDLFSGFVAQINTALSPEECRIRGALLYSHWQGLIVFLRRSGRNAPDPTAFKMATKVVWKAVSNASP